jgi:hypothetical protein
LLREKLQAGLGEEENLNSHILNFFLFSSQTIGSRLEVIFIRQVPSDKWSEK